MIKVKRNYNVGPMVPVELPISKEEIVTAAEELVDSVLESLEVSASIAPKEKVSKRKV
jgi:hypothetical protein